MKDFITSYTKEDIKELIAEVFDEKLSQISSKSEPQEQIDGNTYLTIDDVCHKLHISKGTLHQHINKESIKSFKLGKRRLFLLNDVNSFVQRGQQ